MTAEHEASAQQLQHQQLIMNPLSQPTTPAIQPPAPSTAHQQHDTLVSPSKESHDTTNVVTLPLSPNNASLPSTLPSPQTSAQSVAHISQSIPNHPITSSAPANEAVNAPQAPTLSSSTELLAEGSSTISGHETPINSTPGSPPATSNPVNTHVYTAVYSGIPVYEMMVKGVQVMRRVTDAYLNATQILKVAGFSKPKRTKILERDVLQGEHEKIQGGYGRYQGTW
jgi:hypothetical protein